MSLVDVSALSLRNYYMYNNPKNKRIWIIDKHDNFDELLRHYAKWKKRQSQKITYCMILFIEHFWNDNILEMENRLVIVRDSRSGRGDGVWGYGGCEYKRATQGALVVMDLFSTLTITQAYGCEKIV